MWLWNRSNRNDTQSGFSAWRIALAPAMALFALGALTPAQAMIIPFWIFENGGGVDVSGLDLWLDVQDNGDSTVDFIFGNSGEGVITRLYFERTDPWEDMLHYASMSFGSGVEFIEGAVPPDPPNSISDFGGPWGGTLFSAEALSPQPSNGIGYGETLTIQFSYDGEFDALITALTQPEQLRIVQKIQDLGEGGEYSVWSVTPVPEVPEPATALLLVAGLAVAARAGLTRGRSKARA